MLRRVLVLLGLCVAVGAFTAPAFGAGPALPHTFASIETPHFELHFTSDPADPDYVSFTQASDLTVRFENAYRIETGWGYPAPLNDGDGDNLIDVYVQTLLPGVLGETDPVPAAPLGPAGSSAAYIVLSPVALEDMATIGHELFHAIQFGTWVPTQVTDRWLFEASAEWAGAKVDDYSASSMSTIGPSEMPLDCLDPQEASGQQWCSPNPYVEGGYSRWPFFEAIADRYGTTFLESVLTRGAGGMSALNALDSAIAARGGSLSDVYGDWSLQQMTGYGIPNLDLKGITPYKSVSTGITNVKTGLDVTVDHLATRYIKFMRGDGAADHACFVATLKLTVTLPTKGEPSRPFFYWNQAGSAPVALAIANGVGTASVPWDTCTWSSNAGYLSLPNASEAGPNAAPFHVTWELVLDPGNAPAAAASGPAQLPVYGGQTQVSNADTAPEISVFGPLLLKVSAMSPTLRLIVEASGEGQLHATLGSLDLGTPSLRPGNNDLRFVLPKSVLASLRRRVSATNNVLTLTPVSSSGSATGTAVTRTVTVTRAAPKKTKKK